MTDKPAFATLLGKYRFQCGLTQEGLGIRINVHRNTIRKWEDGESSPQFRGEVLHLADELQLEEEERRDFLKAAGFKMDRWPLEIWNVPHQRNRFFVGREAILEHLYKNLIPGGKVTALTQTVSGLGGIGKTRTAVEYAHQYAQYYKGVLWVQADSYKTLILAYLQLAIEELGLPEQQEANMQIEAVKHWLQTHRGWLLILDNVEEPEQILTKFLPSKHQGCVLITTRRRDIGTLAQSEVLPPFSQEEAVLFVLRRTGRIPPRAPVEKASSEDVLRAKELYMLLGGLPLALEQASAYIDANRCSLLRYIELYQQSWQQLLDRHAPIDHRDSVVMTFRLSCEKIRQHNLLAGIALQCCAFLSSEHIPEELVLEGATLAEGKRVVNELALDEALGLLHRYSLVERAEGMLSIHRLVQEVLQKELPEADQQMWMERIVLVMDAFFPNGEHDTWPQCERLLPHVLLTVQYIRQDLIASKEAGYLLHKTAIYLRERARYAEAEPLFQRALDIQEQQLGSEHPNVAISLGGLGKLYYMQGRYTEAKSLFQRALDIQEHQLGPEHPNVAISLSSLANIYWRQGKYAEAEPLYQHALCIQEQQLGLEHPDVATTLGGLADLYQDQGKYAEAEMFFQRSLHIREQQLGPEHLLMANPLNDLANLYSVQGKYAEAEPLYQHALRIREQQLGLEHPDIATTLNSLGVLYADQGKNEKAKPLYQRALHIWEQQLGPEYPLVAFPLSNLAELCREQGEYAEAEQFCQRALRIREQQLGSEHPDVAASLNNLAEIYREQGKYAEAEPLYQRAFHIWEQQLGPEHPDVAYALDGLANLYRNQSKYTEAELLYQRALRIRKQERGAHHIETAETLHGLAQLKEVQGNYEASNSLYVQALAIRQRVLGEHHILTRQTRKCLITSFHTLGQYEEAAKLEAIQTEL